MKNLLLFILIFLTGCSTLNIPGSTQETLTVPKFYEKPQQPDWNIINNRIRNDNVDVIVLNWEGHGGWNYYGDETISSIESAKRKGKIIIIELTGDAISMHANVLCHASKIEWNGHSAIFHSGFNRDKKDNHKIYTSDRYYFDYCKSIGILIESDILEIINNRQKVTWNPEHKEISEDWK